MKTPEDTVSTSTVSMNQPLASYLKPWEELTIADDYMFKLVMSHMHICKHLLEMILRIKIRKLMEPTTEKAMKVGYESKGIRLDVYVEDNDNTVYDIEMQVRRYPEATLGRRTRYYQSVIDFGALQVGVEYHQLKKSILIFICPFPLFDGMRHIYTFKDTCQEDRSILLDDGASKIFLSTKGKLDDVSKEMKNFLDFVEGLHVQDHWVDEIRNLIVELKKTEKEKVNYMTYQMKIAEERAEAKAEGEDKLSRLIAKLLSLGKNEEILSATKNSALRNQLYEKYGIL